MHIPQSLRNRRQIPGGDSTRAEDNPCVIILRLSATKPVWHNQEINNPPRKCQVRHIGCICILLDAPSERPDPRVLRSNILNLTATTKGLKNVIPNNKNHKSTLEKLVLHIYKPTNTHLNTAISQLITGAFSSACGPASNQQLIKGRTNTHT